MQMYNEIPNGQILDLNKSLISGMVNKQDFLNETTRLYDINMFELTTYGQVAIQVAIEDYVENKDPEITFFKYNKDDKIFIVFDFDKSQNDFIFTVGISNNFFKWNYDKQKLQ